MEKSQTGKLYIVPTPVGNLEDFTFRAVKVLKEADLILAEDTRTTSVLLNHYDIHVPCQSHHKWNEHETVNVGVLRSGVYMVKVDGLGARKIVVR